ncbi:hypothetical protein RAS2_30380 [Phycisphaerae bacterium RAS2]|jgi:hypothetical protein|nr:hypothetical protein RAS2_30380 [Phycisphaerae bacterium RAS2]
MFPQFVDSPGDQFGAVLINLFGSILNALFSGIIGAFIDAFIAPLFQSLAGGMA